MEYSHIEQRTQTKRRRWKEERDGISMIISINLRSILICCRVLLRLTCVRPIKGLFPLFFLSNVLFYFKSLKLILMTLPGESCELQWKARAQWASPVMFSLKRTAHLPVYQYTWLLYLKLKQPWILILHKCELEDYCFVPCWVWLDGSVGPEECGKTVVTHVCWWTRNRGRHYLTSLSQMS